MIENYEEFIEIMKTVGLNQMEFEKYGKNKNYQINRCNRNDF